MGLKKIGKILIKKKKNNNYMEKKINKKSQQVKIEIDETVGQGEYVNFAIVTHSIAEFIIDFIKR